MATQNLTVRIILRNDTSANFQSINPVLLKGEVALELDTQRYKIGDGITAYNDITAYKHLSNSDYLKLQTLIGMLDNDEFGNVDDVTVNGNSVLGEDKIAKVVIGNLTFSDTAQNVSQETFTQDIVLHKISKTGTYDDLINKLVSVDNLNSQSTREPLSANQGRLLKNMVQGIPTARSFENIQALVTDLNGYSETEINTGSNLFIQTLNVPDFWVFSVESENLQYTYSTDDDLISQIKINGSIQIGYYKISMLETEKVDLSDYASIEFVNEIVNTINQNIESLQNNKLDKNQGKDNAGKILGIDNNGNVIPQEATSGINLKYSSFVQPDSFIPNTDLWQPNSESNSVGIGYIDMNVKINFIGLTNGSPTIMYQIATPDGNGYLMQGITFGKGENKDTIEIISSTSEGQQQTIEISPYHTTLNGGDILSSSDTLILNGGNSDIGG